jgi:ribonuclease P protein component
MPNTRIRPPDTFRLAPQERRRLLYYAQPVVKSSALDIRAFPTQSSCGRIMIITPKKSGSAPQRNLVRRRLKALFYEEKLFEKLIDIIVYCKQESTTLSYLQLRDIIINGLITAEKKFHAQASY